MWIYRWKKSSYKLNRKTNYKLEFSLPIRILLSPIKFIAILLYITPMLFIYLVNADIAVKILEEIIEFGN